MKYLIKPTDLSLIECWPSPVYDVVRPLYGYAYSENDFAGGAGWEESMNKSYFPEESWFVINIKDNRTFRNGFLWFLKSYKKITSP